MPGAVIQIGKMYNNTIDTSKAHALEFKTHCFYVQTVGNFISAFCTINNSIYTEMVLSSKQLSYSESLHDRNLRQLAGQLNSLFGIEPNPDFLFKGSPIENERFLIYRFIKSIFQDSDKVVQFESDEDFKQFCHKNNLEYRTQEWWKRIYVQDSYDSAIAYLLQKSLIFQDLYFPSHSEKETSMPTLHDAQAMRGTYHFKNDFVEIYNLLKKNNITRLYHFTDSSNIESIKTYGLLSQKELIRRGIGVRYASSADSRQIDKEMGLDDFVRLSFVKNHPMMFTSMTARGIKPVVLEINPLIGLMPNVFFSDCNALRNGANIGPSASDLNKVRFDITQGKIPYYDLNTVAEKQHYQAEILIKGIVGTEMITNISSL